MTDGTIVVVVDSDNSRGTKAMTIDTIPSPAKASMVRSGAMDYRRLLVPVTGVTGDSPLISDDVLNFFQGVSRVIGQPGGGVTFVACMCGGEDSCQVRDRMTIGAWVWFAC